MPMRFRNWKVSTKQFVIFGFILFLMAISNGMAINHTRDIKDEVDQITSVWLSRVIALSQVNSGATDLRLHQLQYALAESDSVRTEETSGMITAMEQVSISFDRYLELRTASTRADSLEQVYFNRFDESWEDYQDLSFRFAQLSEAGQTAEAVALLRGPRAEASFEAFRNHLLDLGHLSIENSRSAADRAEEVYRDTQGASFTIFTLMFLICGGIAITTARLVTRPLRQLTDAARLVAAGDLDVQIPLNRSDEVGVLARSFNNMTHALKDAHQRMEEQAEVLRTQNTELQATMRELRETQEQLILREKMAGLGALVAGVAHEINNPIGTVLSAVDTSDRCLKRIDQARTDDPESQSSQKRVTETLDILRENVDITRSAGTRIARLVRSLGSFAHLDESDYQVIDIREGIEDSLTLLGSQALQDITVVKEYEDIPRIPCHPAELNQVFFNLLRNATEAIDNHGTITIRTSAEQGSVIVEFADTGRGIPADRLRHIFDVGFSKDTARIKMGSGLSTSYRIIQSHHGDIRVESDEGKGTTVTLVLPTTAPRH
ncbi:MAG: HAMP domain-containing protein [candidate division Zixibacteria bacterium]|nr:HAMP domain-containing protein [candidate division Zixibacteria bacterium]